MVERARKERRTVGGWVTDALRTALAQVMPADEVAELRRRLDAVEAQLRNLQRD